MKQVIVILFSACIGLTNLHSAPSEAKSNAKPDAGGVVIEPSEGQIAPGAIFCGRARPKACLL